MCGTFKYNLKGEQQPIYKWWNNERHLFLVLHPSYLDVCLIPLFSLVYFPIFGTRCTLIWPLLATKATWMLWVFTK
jgi:hypothetical protein